MDQWDDRKLPKSQKGMFGFYSKNIVAGRAYNMLVQIWFRVEGLRMAGM